MNNALQAPAKGDVFLRISTHLAERTDIASALEAVADEIAEVIPFSHADLCLYDRPGWMASYEVGIQTRWSRARTRVDRSPIRDLITGKCDFMLCSDAMQDPRQTFAGACSEPIFNHSLRSRVHVLMKVMGQPIGTLNISHATPALYTSETVQRAQHIADVLSPYFHAMHTAEQAQRATQVGQQAREREEGLRRGALELTQTLEQERQRIGMDLHDQTLADLTRLLREVTGDTPLPRNALSQRITDMISDLRQIIDTAVPTLLELFGFTHAVRVHLERAVGVNPVEIDVTDNTGGAPDRLDQTTRTALFRIAQEAINNAARHSGASRIKVTIEPLAQYGLVMTVSDDGRGIPAGVHRSSGLAHMRTRSRLISAELDILNEYGCTVRVMLASRP
ncbi:MULTISPECIES: sensor histidine kinase [Roseobacteraceae]|jgi:signal transduction histidine kinase|uniref:Signal transduction histidine-protein kinase/phosphatase DegS n=1 Tax=Pseudosulfitobacter pseudonitzschiae TaxID=1402135 RepID=A0A221K5N4_9RHOB|nr:MULTISPECIES: ATP-binding protein [Roseobacteraceae]ASM74314.1 signal transduction histidine-protein kinase/phosphatase DegS [Pseudosulfitobacter pseudonitzschiae]